MSVPALKKRKKGSKRSSPALPSAAASTSTLPLPPPGPPAVARTPPLSAIAARRAAAALAAASSRPPTPPAAPVDVPPEQDLQEAEDDQLRELMADAAFDEDDRISLGFGGEDESSDEGDSSSDEEEEMTLQMDGETILLGVNPRPSKASRRQAKPTKGKGRESMISKADYVFEQDEEKEREGGGAAPQYMEVDTPVRSQYGASTSGTPSVAEGRVQKKRKGYQQGSSYQGAMSAFLPALGRNVIKVDTERLKDAFSDVRDGEEACIVQLESEESIVFSGSCSIYPLLSSLSVFGSVLPPTTSSPPLGHVIYAPLSHPLPVVAPSYGSTAPSPYLSLLGLDPQNLSNCACAFLIREKVSGLEQMSQSVGGLFDGVWEGDTAGWGVRGFFPILSQTSYTAFSISPTWESALATAIPLPSTEPPQPTQSTFEIIPGSPSSSSASLPSPASETEEDSFSPFTAILKGPKRSGKSGMSRALVNRLLRKYQKVAYLETDLGQSEFGPEGAVSLVVLEEPLLGPSFTHPAIPFRAHHFGAATPRNDPTRYLSLVTDLLSAYRLSVQYPPYASTHSAFEASAQDDTKDNRSTAVVPLVINTQGWVKGLGMDLLVKIEQAAEATDVFEFEVVPNGDEWEEGGWEASIPSEGGWGRIYEEPNEEDDQPYGQSTGSARRHLLTPIPPTPLAARWTAYDLRILSLISYFHCRFPAQRSTIDNAGAHASPLATTWDFSLPLVAHRPWAVDWTVAFREIHLVGPGSEEIIPSLIWDALAVGLVALVAPDERESGATTARIDGVPYVQGRPPPSPSTTRLLGFGIVRSPPGDKPLHDKLLHLLTPLPARLLPEATVLVKGETEVPLQAMLDWTQDDSNAGVAGVEREHVPFIEWTGKDGGVGVVGGARRKVRRNVGRRQG